MPIFPTYSFFQLSQPSLLLDLPISFCASFLISLSHSSIHMELTQALGQALEFSFPSRRVHYSSRSSHFQSNNTLIKITCTVPQTMYGHTPISVFIVTSVLSQSSSYSQTQHQIENGHQPLPPQSEFVSSCQQWQQWLHFTSYFILLFYKVGQILSLYRRILYPSRLKQISICHLKICHFP